MDPNSIRVDPNIIKPSPPTSIYSPSSIESLRSITTGSSKSSAHAFGHTSKSVISLPFVPQHEIFFYARQQLAGIMFDIIKEHAPHLLEEDDIEIGEQLEISWACKPLLEYCPNIDRQTLLDWIPDIRHHIAHNNKFTAVAAIRTIDEATKLATSLGYHTIADRFDFLAAEMDAARLEMKKNGALAIKDLPEKVKKAVEDRLVAALAKVKDSSSKMPRHRQALDKEVAAYTAEDKYKENPWTDPINWGKDRNHNPVGNRRPSQPSSSPKLATSWRTGQDDSSSPSTSPSSGRYVPPAMRGQGRK